MGLNEAMEIGYSKELFIVMLLGVFSHKVTDNIHCCGAGDTSSPHHKVRQVLGFEHDLH